MNQHPVICRTHPYRRKNEDSEKRKEKADGKEIAVSRDIGKLKKRMKRQTVRRFNFKHYNSINIILPQAAVTARKH